MNPISQFSLSAGTLFFIYSVVSGFFFGLCYEIIRILRRAIPHADAAIAIEDFIFFVFMSAAFAILVFSANSGEVRGYALIGSLIGACIYFATLGRLLTLLSEAIISLVKRIFAFLTKKLLIPALKAVKNEIIKLHSILIRLRSRRLGRAFIHDASHGFLSASTSRKLKSVLTESSVVQKKRIEKKTQEGK